MTSFQELYIAHNDASQEADELLASPTLLHDTGLINVSIRQLSGSGSDIGISLTTQDVSIVDAGHQRCEICLACAARCQKASIDDVHRTYLRAKTCLGSFIDNLNEIHEKVLKNLPPQDSDLPPSYTSASEETSVKVLKRFEKRLKKLNQFVEEQKQKSNSAQKLHHQLSVAIERAISFQNLHSRKEIVKIKIGKLLCQELLRLIRGLGTEISNATLAEFKEQEMRYLNAVQKTNVARHGKRAHVILPIYPE